MSKARIKIEVPQIETREQAEATMGALTLISATKRIAAARMDEELTMVKNKYATQLSDCDAVIEIESQKLEAWATAHPEIFPKNRKSLELLAGTLGFRKDTPSLVLVDRTFTWAKVLAMVTKAKWRKFVRVKAEVDKDAILARSGTLEKPTKFQRIILPQLGLKIAQKEQFFVEPKLTDVEVKP